MRSPALPARPRRPHDAEATREALLTAGAELFAEHGFDGVTVEAIAGRAQANKALISYHFGGKAGLYSAILSATFGSMAADLESLRASDRPADELLREFVGLVGAMVARRPSLPRMVLREVLSGGERLHDRDLPHFLALFGTVRSIVERGVRTGRFRKVDPALTHIGLIGSLMFFFSTERFRQQKLARAGLPAIAPPPQKYLDHVAELMVRGLAHGPARPGR